MSEARERLLSSIAKYIGDPDSHEFDELARRAFAFQHQRSSRFREACRLRGVDPNSIDSWIDVPTVEAESRESASRVAGDLSVLQRAALDSTWTTFCLDQLVQPPILSLLPNEVPEPDPTQPCPNHDSRLAYIAERWGGSDSLVAIEGQKINTRLARGFLAARQRDGEPILIAATPTTLDQLIESLQRLDLRFRMSSASIVVELDDSNKTEEIPYRGELYDSIETYLAIPSSRLVRGLGGEALATQLFTDVLTGGDTAVFVAPHWVRLSTGERGNLRVFDLANLEGALHLETTIRGTIEAQGFRPLER